MSVQTRGRLIEAAKRVFSEKGYYNAQITHIIDEAGVARGTFYLYFKGKEDIFKELLREVVEELKERIKEIDPSYDPVQQVRDNLRRVIEFALEERELARIVIQKNCDTQLFNITNEFFREVVDLIRSSLEKGIKLGLIRKCDTELVAWGILGAVKEIIASSLDREDVNPGEVAREIVEIGIRGVWNGRGG